MTRTALCLGLFMMTAGLFVASTAHAEAPATTRSEALPSTLFEGQTAKITAAGRAALNTIAASVKPSATLIITAAFDRAKARPLAEARATAMALYFKNKNVKTKKRASKPFAEQDKSSFGHLSFGAYLGLRKQH